jgi:hypothetical protein
MDGGKSTRTHAHTRTHARIGTDQGAQRADRRQAGVWRDGAAGLTRESRRGRGGEEGHEGVTVFITSIREKKKS